MVARRLVDYVVRGQTRDARRFSRSVRKHTFDLVRHPIRTVVQTSLMTGIFLFMFVLVTNPEGLATLASTDGAGVADVLAVLPHPVLLVPLVVGLVLLVLFATVSANVKNDLRFR